MYPKLYEFPTFDFLFNLEIRTSIEGFVSLTDDLVLESDLVGVEPWLMGKILFFLMMVIPIGTIPVERYGVDWLWSSFARYTAMMYGLFWKLDSFELSPNNLWLDPAYLLFAIPVIVLNIIFAFEVVRYYKALVSRKHVLIVGTMSFLVPLLLAMITRVLLPESAAYFGPLPFLLIVGLLLLYKIPGPEIEPIVYLSDILQESDMEEVH